MNFPRRILLAICILALAGVLAAAPAAFAQECPRGPGVPELPTPSVTAAEADADPSKLKDFALAALSATTAPSRNIDEASYIACLFRLRGGPFFSGSTYTVTLTLDGRVWMDSGFRRNDDQKQRDAWGGLLQ